MPIRVVTGLDWSGDSGSYEKAVRESPYLVIGACHAPVDARAEIAEKLAEFRRQLRIPNDHVFKYAKSSTRVKHEFFQIICQCPIAFTVHATDKRLWNSQVLANSTGLGRIRAAIVELIDACENEHVCGQRLLVDASRSDARFMRDLRADIRRRQRQIGRDSFAKVVPVPDSRSDGLLIQAADMIAGYAVAVLMSGQPVERTIQSKVRFVGDVIPK